MKKIMMYVMIAAAMLAGCVSGPKVDNAPVAELDLNRYLERMVEPCDFVPLARESVGNAMQ